MRTLIVCLTVAALLACPLDCAARLATAQSAGANQLACCAKCRGKESAPTPAPSSKRLPAGQLPSQPTPCEDGKDCLCEGAVIDATARAAVDDALRGFLLACPTNAHALSVAAGKPCLTVTEPPLPAGGSFARIVLCALVL
jgi:hypothetical protein